MVCTSNKRPSDLYKDGLNRQYFLPFVKLMQKQLAIVEVRLSAGRSIEALHHTYTGSTEASIADIVLWQSLQTTRQASCLMEDILYR